MTGHAWSVFFIEISRRIIRNARKCFLAPKKTHWHSACSSYSSRQTLLCRQPAANSHFMLKHLANLRSRLILLILLAVVPAFGLILDSATSHRELTARQVKQSALATARVIAAEQDRVLENAHQFLVTLARVPQIRDNDKASCRKILAALLEPRYADLVVADRRGNPLCTALPADSSLARSKGLHHSRSLETYDFAVGNLRFDPGTGKTLLDVSYPMSEQPGVVRAVV
jgi:hypothetical protein